MTVTGAIRFLVGASLVVAGGSLVAPLVTKLANAAGLTARGHAVDGSPAMRVPAVDPAAAPPTAVPGPSLPQAACEEASGVDPWVGFAGDTTMDSAGGLQLDRCPPPPPAPLPPPPHELAQANPALGDAYRSTLQVPPPRLLDASGPPPVATWVAPSLVPSAIPAAVIPPSRALPAHEITVPATYCIRDGDDLGTIAGRFYGDTAAAPAIWAANRETIPHPDLLPVGAELRLPPSWAVHGLRRPTAGAIEPVSYARPATVPADHGPATHAVPWLAPAADPPAPAAAAMPPAHPAPAGASGVRVGPGETLVSLARRLYGDPAMAEQIFLANRDRLRSPELLVAGMELRLPRPVTAPRP